MIQTIILFIVSLLVVVVIHELGHFLVSKGVGVAVEEFGIGFPPRLFGKMWRGTLYSVNALPIGAFVRARGENDPKVEGSLAAASPGRRFLVYVAGPLANILLAFVLFTAFFGLPRAVVVSDGLLVHGVDDDSPAQAAGLSSGDIILNANGALLQTWEDLESILTENADDRPVQLDVLRGDDTLVVDVVPQYSETLDRNIIGVTLWRNVVIEAEPGSLADQAGIQPGDGLLGVNARNVVNQSDLDDALAQTGADETVVVTMLRDATTYSFELTGTQLESEPLGLSLKWAPGTRTEKRSVSFLTAALASSEYIIAMPALIVASVPLMREDPSLAFVGPIGAGQLTIEAVQVFGPSNLIFIAGLISIGIALFNLIPIPPLDGGGILVAFIEFLRRGRRLSERSVRLAYAVGTSLLITLVIFITTSDLLRLIQGRGFGL